MTPKEQTKALALLDGYTKYTLIKEDVRHVIDDLFLDQDGKMVGSENLPSYLFNRQAIQDVMRRIDAEDDEYKSVCRNINRRVYNAMESGSTLDVVTRMSLVGGQVWAKAILEEMNLWTD